MINSNPFHQLPPGKTLALWGCDLSMYPGGTNEVALLIRPTHCQLGQLRHGCYTYLGRLSDVALMAEAARLRRADEDLLVNVHITREDARNMLEVLEQDWSDTLKICGPGEGGESTPATPSLEPDSFTDRAIADCTIFDKLGTDFFIRLLVRPTDIRCDESGQLPDELFVQASITREELTEILRRIDNQEKAWNERRAHP